MKIAKVTSNCRNHNAKLQNWQNEQGHFMTHFSRQGVPNYTLNSSAIYIPRMHDKFVCITLYFSSPIWKHPEYLPKYFLRLSLSYPQIRVTCDPSFHGNCGQKCTKFPAKICAHRRFSPLETYLSMQQLSHVLRTANWPIFPSSHLTTLEWIDVMQNPKGLSLPSFEVLVAANFKCFLLEKWF